MDQCHIGMLQYCNSHRIAHFHCAIFIYWTMDLIHDPSLDLGKDPATALGLKLGRCGLDMPRVTCNFHPHRGHVT